MVRGVDILADTKLATLGPENVVLEKLFGFTPLITNDGVTIAKEIGIGNINHFRNIS